MPILDWFIFCTLSWHGVRLSVNWVNVEWDSMSTESTQKAQTFTKISSFHVDSVDVESMRSETPCQLSQRGVRLHVHWVNAESTNIYKDFIIQRWLSWHGVSLCVDSVDVESHLALTQLTGNETAHQLSHRWMLKIWISQRIQEQNRKHSKVLFFGLYMFDQCKKLEQKNLMQVYH